MNVAIVELTEPISTSKDVTVDLNGKTLTSTVAAFEVTAGTLTITGNGVVEAVTSHANKAGIWAKGGNIVIKNGDFSVGDDENGTINPCVYVGSQGGFITIDGGKFTHVGNPDNGTAIINVQNDVDPKNGKIIINAAEIVVPAGGSVTYEERDVAKGVIVDNRKN